jgi:hypothetical protein
MFSKHIQTSLNRGFVLYSPGVGCESSKAGSLFCEDYSSFLFVPDNSEGRKGDIVGLKTISYLKLSSFMYSLTNITSLAVPFILKDTLLLSPAQLGLFSAMCAAPSFLKPVCTLMVDRKQRPLLLFGIGAVQTVSYIAVGLAVTKGIATIPLVCGIMFAHATATAAGMVLRDSMMIETAASLGSEQDAHFFFSDVSMIQRFGLLPVSYLSGYLLDFVSPGSVIIGAAICPAVMTIAASFLDTSGTGPVRETTTEQLQTAIAQLQDKRNGLMSTVTGRGLLTSIVPSYADAMFFFYTSELGLSAEFLGRFQFLGCVAGIMGNLLSKHSKNPRRLANAANILLIPLYGSILLITSHVPLGPISVGSFILWRHFVIDFFNSLTVLPAAVQLMKSAPQGAEGTYLALTGTISDTSNVLNSVLSSGAVSLFGINTHDFSNLSNFVFLSLSGSAALLPTILYYEDDNMDITVRGTGATIEELDEEVETSSAISQPPELESLKEGSEPEERSPRDA